MSEDRPPGPLTPSDLLEVWRRAATDMEQHWNEYLNQAMGTDTFAQAIARSLDGYLALQTSFASGMEQYLKSVNIPTRNDFIQLSERIGLLEQRIADLTAALALSGVSVRVEPSVVEPAPEPAPRTRSRVPRRGA